MFPIKMRAMYNSVSQEGFPPYLGIQLLRELNTLSEKVKISLLSMKISLIIMCAITTMCLHVYTKSHTHTPHCHIIIRK